MIIHGTNDNTVGNIQPFAFSDSLNSKGYCTRLSILQGRQHDLLKFIDMPNDPVRQRVNNYLDSLLSGRICNNITGINEQISFEETVSIFPNPTTDIIKVKFDNAFNGNLHVRNISGVKILSSELKDSQFQIINLSSFPKGLYFLEIESSADGYRIEKIIYK